MPETRKLAAILAADVVGYSKLAGADEDRTLVRLRRQKLKPIVVCDSDVEVDYPGDFWC
jgi:class 3 adenylate cyclase